MHLPNEYFATNAFEEYFKRTINPKKISSQNLVQNALKLKRLLKETRSGEYNKTKNGNYPVEIGEFLGGFSLQIERKLKKTRRRNFLY